MAHADWGYNICMQKDKLEKYETEPSTLPRQTNRSLAKLPRPQRRWLLVAFIIFGLVLVASGLWLGLR